MIAGHRRRQHLALLEERRDEAITDAAVLDALADGEDVGIGRLHEVVDDDAALDVRPALRPSSTFGRIPAATTTRFASSCSPSANSTPSTRPLPRIAFVLLPSSTRMPSSSIFASR